MSDEKRELRLRAEVERLRSDRDAWKAAHDLLVGDAQRLAALRAENKRMREALEWYGEQARLARLTHSEGDAGRAALAADGGERAREALTTWIGLASETGEWGEGV